MSPSASFPNPPNNENAEWPNEKKYTNSIQTLLPRTSGKIPRMPILLKE